jgi:hypothetical protein
MDSRSSPAAVGIAALVLGLTHSVPAFAPPKWQSKLAAFDVYIWDQCYAMEQSLRID